MDKAWNVGVCKIYHVYGADGHRQKESFSLSYELQQTSDGGMVEVRNADYTGTNEYSEIIITADSEERCDEILEGHLSDGIFENCRTGKIETVYKGDVMIEKLGRVSLRARKII